MTDKQFSIELKPDEKTEPLDETHYIIQSATGYRFGSDAVALAKYASTLVHMNSRIADLCSGCGIIGILVAIETDCAVDGVDLDEGLYDMSVRSAALNALDKVKFRNADVRNIDKTLAPAAYDAVVCNPPFYKADSRPSKIAPNANSELTVTLDDIIHAAAFLLKAGGALCLVHTATRLDETLVCCRDHGLTPKELVINRNCKTFMLKAVRGGKAGMTLKLTGNKEDM